MTRNQSINLQSSKYCRSGHRPWYVYDETRGRNSDVRDAWEGHYHCAWVLCVSEHASRSTDCFCPRLDFQVNTLG